MPKQKVSRKTQSSSSVRNNISAGRKKVANVPGAGGANLTEAQRMAQQLIETLPNPIFFKSIDGRYLGVNKAWEDFFAMPRDAFVGKTVFDLYPDDPETAQRLHADDQMLWDHPGTSQYETKVTTPDGKKHDAIYYKATFTNSDGAVAGLIGTIIDITARKQGENALSAANAQLETLIQSSPLAIYARDANGLITSWNPAAERIYGWPASEVIGKPLPSVPDDSRQESDEIRRQMLAGGSFFKVEVQRRRRDGSTIFIDAFLSPLRDASGNITGIMTVAADITERKEFEQRYRDTFELAPVGIARTSPEGKYLQVNKKFAEMLGCSTEELLAMSPQDFIHLDDRDHIQQERNNLLSGASNVISGERRFVRKDGRVIWAKRTLSLCRDSSGQPLYIIGVIEDITEDKEREERYRAMFENAAVGITRVDLKGILVDINQKFCDMLGYTRDELIGKAIKDITHPDDYGKGAQFRAKVTQGNLKEVIGEKRFIRKDGVMIWAKRSMSTVLDYDGSPQYIISVVEDITERKQAELLLHEREAELYRFQYTLAQTLDCIFMFRMEDFRFIYVNQGAQRQVGYTEAELLTMSPLDIKPEHTQESLRQLLRPLIDGTQASITVDTVHRHKDGHDIPVEIVIQLILQTGGQRCFVAIVRDITERKQAEARILHLANYDELTGLANRNMFSECLRQALARALRSRKVLAILFIDLDRFKNINDTLGHAAGDTVLEDVAERLRNCLRASDTVGRLGGDEFVVLLEDMPQPTHSAAVAQKILAAIAKPFILDTQQFQITASIGISSYPADSEDMQSLLKNADIAMYHAKELGKNNFQFYSAQMNLHTMERLALESSLRGALERNEFVLHYQPKIDIRSGDITGMEALVRWQHPVNGLIPPMQFIPLAEETGLIVAIGEWVLRTACAQNESWRKQGLPPLRVAVNLSGRQFNHDTLLLDVDKVLKDTGLDSAGLELEITESMVMDDPERAVIVLDELRAMGISISIDDFGTGYSSLSYLKRFPIDSLKIDRSFIKDLPQDNDDAAIAQAIIAMAHSLKISVIAEGVETVEQLNFLRDNLCDEVQGYYYSKPVPEQEFARLVLNSVASRKAAKAKGSRS